MWCSFGFAVLILFLIRKLWFLNWKRKGFWEKYGVPEIDPSSVVSEIDVLLGKRDITERDDYIYEKMGTSKFCGMLESPTPILLIKDLDLVKKVLIKDFDHFIDRRQFFGAARRDSVLRKMLGNLQGDEWKGVRASVSPTFTTGKIRRMMEYINSVGKEWVGMLRSNARQTGFLEVDVFTCASQYTADVIASAIFGLDAGTVRDPQSLFSIMAYRLTAMNKWQLIKFTLSLRFPKIFQLFDIDILDMEALHFFEKLLKQKLNERMNGKVWRNDFLQLLVEARNGDLKGIGSDELNNFETDAQLPENTGRKLEKRQYLTDKVMSGQTLSFFFAGFRTTSSFITFCIYTMAVHQDVQEKLRKEIDSIFGEDGLLDYDTLGRLVYLDMVVCEILRKFPATMRLERTCISDYHDLETGIYVPKGAIVGIPLKSIHNDKRFYDNPEEFDPEHFRPDKKAARNPYAFIPFGIGARNCIGMRFALVESKAAISHLVHNFRIEPIMDKTPIPLTGRRANFQISPPQDLRVKLIPRN